MGRYAGAALKKIPSEIVAFSDFVAAHPTGLVLSRETGYLRPYGRNPYAGSDRIDESPFLFTGKKDDRLPPMVARLACVIFSKGGMASPLDAERIEAGRPIPAATAFERRLDGRVLDFFFKDGGGAAQGQAPAGRRKRRALRLRLARLQPRERDRARASIDRAGTPNLTSPTGPVRVSHGRNHRRVW